MSGSSDTYTTVAAPRRSLQAPLWLIALVTFTGTVAMHVFVPALPIAGKDLGVGAASMQLTISLYIMGLAVGQLIYGPVSDRLGRRPTLLAGLAIYTVSSLGAALAANVEILIAARLLQALGGCAGLVLGRAMLRDNAAPIDAARRLATLNLMVTLGPGIAPLVGGALAGTTGWRSIFVVLTGLGVVSSLLAWRLLPETSVRTPSSVADLARSYGRLLRSPAFLGYAIGGGCATTSMYAFIAAAPFIFVQELHQPIDRVGVYVAILVMGIWVGSMLASRLLARISIRRLLIGANGISVVAAVALLASVLSGHDSVWLTIALMFAFTLGAGTASPAALTEAVSIDPRIIGSASGLYGFTQMAVGALCTALVGLFPNPAIGAAAVLTGAGAIAQASFWVAARHRLRPAPAA